MKLTRKIFTIVLTLCMILCLGATAFAAEGESETAQYTDAASITVTKVYKLVGAGSSPAETFTLQQVGNGTVKDGDATSAPALGTITGASFDAGAATADGATATITINLPTYDKVGIYEYTLEEVAGTTAGVTYYGNNIKLVVTVINDSATGKLRIAAVHTESTGDQKTDHFPNTYSAGTLNVTKTVTGNLGDKSKYFKFTVTLTGEKDKAYGETYAVTGGSYKDNPSSIKIGVETTFYLKDGETISIANLPYGVSYTVVEDTYSDYTTTKEGDTGSISSASATAAFTNSKGGTPDTGITLDSLPYILTLAFVALGSFVLISKKRSAKNR